MVVAQATSDLVSEPPVDLEAVAIFSVLAEGGVVVDAAVGRRCFGCTGDPQLITPPQAPIDRSKHEKREKHQDHAAVDGSKDRSKSCGRGDRR